MNWRADGGKSLQALSMVVTAIFAIVCVAAFGSKSAATAVTFIGLFMTVGLIWLLA